MRIVRIALLSMALTLGTSFAPFVASAQQPGAPNSLYGRLGGLKGITVVVDDFINRLVANEELNKNPAIDAGRKRSPAPYLKFQVAQMVCEATGGPCKYTGKAMKESHSHLNISEQEWGVMAAEFKKSLDTFKVPAAEQKELFDIVGRTKADIVARKQELVKDQLGRATLSVSKETGRRTHRRTLRPASRSHPAVAPPVLSCPAYVPVGSGDAPCASTGRSKS